MITVFLFGEIFLLLFCVPDFENVGLKKVKEFILQIFLVYVGKACIQYIKQMYCISVARC